MLFSILTTFAHTFQGLVYGGTKISKKSLTELLRHWMDFNETFHIYEIMANELNETVRFSVSLFDKILLILKN